MCGAYHTAARHAVMAGTVAHGCGFALRAALRAPAPHPQRAHSAARLQLQLAHDAANPEQASLGNHGATPAAATRLGSLYITACVSMPTTPAQTPPNTGDTAPAAPPR